MDRKIQIMERRRIIRKIISFFHFNKLIGAEIVVFPQHEIFYTDSASYLKEAAQLDIDFIGGLDPYSIDGSIEEPVDYMVQ